VTDASHHLLCGLPIKGMAVDIVPPYLWLSIIFTAGGVGILVLARMLPRIKRQSWW